MTVFSARPRHLPAPAKAGPVVHTDREMLAVLRRLALGGPTLSRRTFEQRRQSRDPSAALYERRFGSWFQALEEAGLAACEQPLQLRGATTKWSEPELVEAVRRCLTETGSSTLLGYEAWRAGITGTPETAHEAVPTASTIRFRLGSWSRATRLACRRGTQHPTHPAP